MKRAISSASKRARAKALAPPASEIEGPHAETDAKLDQKINSGKYHGKQQHGPRSTSTPPPPAQLSGPTPKEPLIEAIMQLLTEFTPGAIEEATRKGVQRIELAAQLGTSYSAQQWAAAAQRWRAKP